MFFENEFQLIVAVLFERVHLPTHSIVMFKKRSVFSLAQDTIYQTWSKPIVVVEFPVQVCISTLNDWMKIAELASNHLKIIQSLNAFELKNNDIKTCMLKITCYFQVSNYKIGKYILTRYHSRFFAQLGHETTYAPSGNKQFFTKSCHRQA